MRKYCLFALVVLMVMSCAPEEKPGPPPEALSRKKFTEIMIDVQLIEGMKVHKLGPRRENHANMEPLYREIFEKHGVTSDKFQTTFDYYKRNPGEMKLIYEEVLDSLSKLEAEVKQLYSEEQRQMRDSLNEAVARSKDSTAGKTIREPVFRPKR